MVAQLDGEGAGRVGEDLAGERATFREIPAERPVLLDPPADVGADGAADELDVAGELVVSEHTGGRRRRRWRMLDCRVFPIGHPVRTSRLTTSPTSR
jgi:hypothetical protein